MNPLVTIPDHKTVREKLIDEVREECVSDIVMPKLNSLSSVTINFDLWMSRGCEDIFDLIAHGLDTDFKPVVVHIAMIQWKNTTGEHRALR